MPFSASTLGGMQVLYCDNDGGGAKAVGAAHVTCPNVGEGGKHGAVQCEESVGASLRGQSAAAAAPDRSQWPTVRRQKHSNAPRRRGTLHCTAAARMVARSPRQPSWDARFPSARLSSRLPANTRCANVWQGPLANTIRAVIAQRQPGLANRRSEASKTNNAVACASRRGGGRGGCVHP